MTGPEHFKMAEELLKAAHATADPENDNSDEEVTFLVGLMMQRAQVHATLALAAATALCGTDPDGSSYVGDMNAWHRAAGVKPASEEPQS